MRDLWSGQRRWNDTLDELSVARYSRTGMFTIPNCIEPFQIDRATSHLPRPAALFARLAARSVHPQVKSRAREAEQASQRRGIAGPVLGDELRRGHADDVAQRERRDDRAGER